MSKFEADQAAIVTGGSQGLGLAIASEMVDSGLRRVAIVGRNPAKGDEAVADLKGRGAEALFVAADLAQPDAAPRVVAQAVERFGRVHALINAAATTERDSVWDSDVERFDRIFATNVRGPYLLIQGVARSMRDNGTEGSIVNIGSTAAHGGAAFITSYSASKGALLALTRNLANSLAPDRIRVNLVNPGWMNTPAEDHIQRTYHGAGDDWLEEAGRGQPFGRLIDPVEVARLVTHLASRVSGLITGAVIDFDQHVVGTDPVDPEDG